jgi:hypothetical protein
MGNQVLISIAQKSGKRREKHDGKCTNGSDEAAKIKAETTSNHP